MAIKKRKSGGAPAKKRKGSKFSRAKKALKRRKEASARKKKETSDKRKAAEAAAIAGAAVHGFNVSTDGKLDSKLAAEAAKSVAAKTVTDLGITLKTPGKVSRIEANQAVELAISKLNIPDGKDRSDVAKEAAIKAAARKGFNIADSDGNINEKEARKVAKVAAEKKIKQFLNDPEMSRKDAARAAHFLSLLKKDTPKNEGAKRQRRNTI